jgi:hypothetical protein
LISWVEGISCEETSSTTHTIIFDLDDSSPYKSDDSEEKYSNFYALRDGTVIISGSDGIQIKQFMDGTFGSGDINVCNPNMISVCWEVGSGNTARKQNSLLLLGTSDPTT